MIRTGTGHRAFPIKFYGIVGYSGSQNIFGRQIKALCLEESCVSTIGRGDGSTCRPGREGNVRKIGEICTTVIGTGQRTGVGRGRAVNISRGSRPADSTTQDNIIARVCNRNTVRIRRAYDDNVVQCQSTGGIAQSNVTRSVGVIDGAGRQRVKRYSPRTGKTNRTSRDGTAISDGTTSSYRQGSCHR